MPSPLFSVVIATYNKKHYAVEAVKSVFAQTYPAHEIIVVDDGSDDGTADDVRSLFPSVIVMQQPNLGKCVARNTGIAAATGDWICILDHDDLWHREKLSRVAAEITRHPLRVAYTHPVWFFSEDVNGPNEGWGFLRDFVAPTLADCHEAASVTTSRNDFQYLNFNGNSFDALLDRRLGAMSATVIRRDILLRAGMFCPMQFNGEDWTVFVNVARFGEWGTVTERLGFTRLDSTSGTYEQTGGLMQLACQINAWHSGRPLIRHVRGLDYWADLDQRRVIHRRDIQKYLWAAIYQGKLRLARLILAAGGLLITRLRDYIYICLPPQITWRWERYIVRTIS